ncbi:hypothetical protein A0256_15440 [Mucilaginibacter sp. PAMC 26640]|nr:hypothetical protein A0256_15440 [Mucilaginibacter sp. PAMC 26640]
MGEIYIVNDQANTFTKKIVDELKVKSLDFHELVDEPETDGFIIPKFQKNKIDKILIPVSLGVTPNNQIGFKLGLHIRFSNEINDDYLVPIIFISDKSLETLLLSRNEKYPLIAVTEGCMLCPEDINEIRANLDAIQPLRNENYLNVLNSLIINKPETMGPHSLANEWGVYQLDRVAKLASLSATAPAYLKSKTLYFKYLRAKNNAIASALARQAATGSAVVGSPGQPVGPNTIDAIRKKILYIDDEGFKGWTSALSVIFKGGTVTSITGDGLSETEFFKSIREEIGKDWDLILLDLRLLPLKEDIAGIVLPIDRYSGTEILREIKDRNEGTQVIIFTASNKAWNMKQLLELKADGYYIKESPEYLIPDDLSLKNYEAFKEQVKACFDRIYLKSIFKAHQNAIAQTTFSDTGFLTFSEFGLKRSFELIRLGMFEAAYINYFQIIENYDEIVFDSNSKSVVDSNGTTIHAKTGSTYHMTFRADTVNGNYLEKLDTNASLQYATLTKLSFIMAFKFSKDDTYLIKVGTLVKIRNDIAHTGGSTLLDVSNFFDLIAIIHLFRANN